MVPFRRPRLRAGIEDPESPELASGRKIGENGSNEQNPGRVDVRKVTLVLVSVLLCGSLAAQDFSFDPDITQDEFEEFSLTIGRAIYASPVEPAHGGSVFSFDVGVAVTAVEVNEDAAFWIKSVDENILQEGYLLAPRVIVSKGFGRVNISGSYMMIPETDVEVWGAALDIPIIRGGLTSPTIAARGTWADVRGVEELDLQVIGLEGFISKGFGPITPYAGFGVAQTEATGMIEATELTPEILLNSDTEEERITVGVKLSLLLFKVVVEAVQTDDTTYGAKFSFSL